MGLPPFGALKPLCESVPSYPICNLFFRQLARLSPSTINLPSGQASLTDYENIAPVGINPECGIPRWTNGQVGNIANIVACGVSIVFVVYLIWMVTRRVAAVGRIELRSFLFFYLLSLPLQIVTTGSFLKQSSTPLVIVTAIHLGVVAALFWALLANALVATQVVEDGTMASMVPFWIISILIFAATTYISLDTAFGFSTAFQSHPPDELKNIALFVLTSVWPAFCAFAYFVIMLYVVIAMLREGRPSVYYALAALLFVLAQLAYFLLSKVICRGAGHHIDGSFVATLLETAAVGVLVGAWISITEETWDDDYYPS